MNDLNPTANARGLLTSPGFIVIATGLLLLASAYLDGTVRENATALFFLNALFLGAVGVGLSILAARAYLATGRTQMLISGMAFLLSGAGALASGAAVELAGINATVTIHNLAGAAAAALHLRAALSLRNPGRTAGKPAAVDVVVAYTASLAVVALLCIGAGFHLLPVFIGPSRPLTPVRIAVLTVAAALLTAAAVLFMEESHRRGSGFLRTYSAGLAFTAVGLVLVLLSPPGSGASWLGRFTQYAANLYLCATVFGANRQARERGTRTVDVLSELFHPAEEANVSRILSASLNGIYIFDLIDRQYVYINSSYTRLTGYTLGQLRAMDGPGLLSLFHPDDHAAIRAHLARMGRLPEDRRGELEYRFRTADGRWIWCLSMETVFARGLDGRPAQTIGSFLDITARKLAEEELRQGRLLLSEAERLSHTGAWEWDLAADRWSFSDEWLRIHGCPQRSLRIEDLIAIAHPEDRTAVAQALERARSGDAPYKLDHRIVRMDDGRVRTIRAYGRNLRDASGRVVKVYGFAQDVTERSRAEEALRASEEKFRKIFRTSGSPISISTVPDGRYIDVNDAFLDLTGFAREEVVGRTVVEVGVWADIRDRERVAARLLREERVRNEQVMLRTKDGRLLTTLISATFLDIGGERCIVAAGTDITALKRAEEKLRQLNETLEQRVAERTELAEARARQLQTLAVELIESEERERRRFAQLLHDDLQQILAAARLQLEGAYAGPPPESLAGVERLLDEAIQTSRHLSHEMSPAVLYHSGLTAGLQWVAARMHAQFGLEVTLKTEGVPDLKGGPLNVFLVRAVQELLFNIVKHAKVKQAELVLARENGCLSLTVSDRGVGFDPGILAGTSGLGLLSLRERAAYIGGSIAIDSSPGGGSRFRIAVPVQIPSERDRRESECRLEPAADLPPPAAGGQIRVLLVDDHQVIRQGLRKLIAGKGGIRVVGEAANGLQAIEHSRRLEPDVVIMDVSMPIMNGIDATRRIKAERPGIRVIGLSMHADPALTRSMQQAGAEALISKAAGSGELLQAIAGPPAEEGSGIRLTGAAGPGHRPD